MRIAIIALICTTAALLFAADPPARKSPPFTIQRAGAPPIQLEQFHGKIVALAFIHTTCPHCQALTKDALNPIAKEYAPKDVQIVECAFNPGAENLVQPFAQAFQTPFPVGFSNDAAVRAYLGYSVIENKIFYVPHLVFLDRRGMIEGDYPGESPFFQNPAANIRAELDKMLKAGSAPTARKK